MSNHALCVLNLSRHLRLCRLFLHGELRRIIQRLMLRLSLPELFIRHHASSVTLVWLFNDCVQLWLETRDLVLFRCHVLTSYSERNTAFLHTSVQAIDHPLLRRRACIVVLKVSDPAPTFDPPEVTARRLRRILTGLLQLGLALLLVLRCQLLLQLVSRFTASAQTFANKVIVHEL